MFNCDGHDVKEAHVTTQEEALYFAFEAASEDVGLEATEPNEP